ncbi:hypothetical protein [Siphonobacter aquaeclarae]|jgi:hypothetical protein|uniref:Uncharacterized protein n=1 Tax=Siphonobacter aquaeclarae TaxID=563176 RepID=A0A1G9XLW6_9BACT|nr:hypothetical protein [Siphonobacter aquaeclarae]SDM97832.1 hypothetical protein SAMN04488090_4676 [Siphonobacter aquaeclarae]
MQDIEPFYGWEKQYTAADDSRSPFYGREYNFQEYENAIYGYYIHPNWDEIGSETLYCKILFTDYDQHYTIIELLGEWNDTLHNDIMFFKRNVVDPLVGEGINQFILIGENVLNFHGTTEDDYYAEWFEEVEDGWIVALNFRDFVEAEFTKYHLDYYINYGGTLEEIPNWRTLKPNVLYEVVRRLIQRRLGT